MDIVIIVAGNSYATHRSVINCYDATIEFPGLEEGERVAPVIAALLAAGFALMDFDGSDSVTTYCLYRETDPIVCDPLVPISTHQNRAITIVTGAGSISGTLMYAGNNVVEVLEATGDIVLIPVGKIQAWM